MTAVLVAGCGITVRDPEGISAVCLWFYKHFIALLLEPVSVGFLFVFNFHLFTLVGGMLGNYFILKCI